MKLQQEKERKVAAAAEKAHREQIRQLMKDKEENDAKVRMEKELAKEKHDNIVQKAIE